MDTSFLKAALPHLPQPVLDHLAGLNDEDLSIVAGFSPEKQASLMGLPPPPAAGPVPQAQQTAPQPYPTDEVLKGISPDERARVWAGAGDEYLQTLISRHEQYAQQFAAGRPAFVPGGEVSPENLRYATWARDTGRLSSAGGPGFWKTIGETVASLGAGTVETGIEAARYRKAELFGTEQEKADAESRDQAFSAEAVNQLRGFYGDLGAGVRRLGSRVVDSTFGAVAELQGDPAFRARVQSSDDQSWYKYHASIAALSADQASVHDAAADIAIRAGWSESGLTNAATAASFVADPGQLVTEGAMRAAGKVAATFVPRAALGIADGMRAEVAAGAKNVATLEQTAARLGQLHSEDAVAMHEAVSGDLEAARADQARKAAALSALDAKNSSILAAAGRPALALRLAAGAGVAAATATEQAGEFLSRFNVGVVDGLLQTADATPGLFGSRLVKRIAPTSVAGAAIAAANGGDWKEGAAIGALVPGALANAGRLSRILGENFLVGRASVPYFARLASDAEATGVERWAFRHLDTFTPAADFVRNIGSAAAKGASIGAAFGFAAAGGEKSDLASAAGAGVAGHYAPWAMISNLHGFWGPVRSPAELEGIRAANLRLLKDRWAGSDNLSRLQSLPPSAQLDIAHLVAANPDFTLRLVGRDDAVISADQLGNGAAPGDFSNVPGFHYKDPTTGRSVLVLNPAHPDAMRPVVAHELIHKAQSEGLAASIVTELTGDPELGLPGMFTRLDPATGSPVRRDDGSFATTPDFDAAKTEYERRLSNAGVPTKLTDAEFALEHAAEQGADFMLSAKFDEALRPTVGSLMASLPALRDAAGAVGITLDPKDQNVKGTMGLGLRRSPAVEKILNAYVAQWRVGQNAATADAAAKSVEISRDQIARNPDILKLFAGSSAVNVDAKTGLIAGTRVDPATGKLVIVDAKKVFKSAAQIAKEQGELSQFVIEAVKGASDVATEKDAVKVRAEGGREIAAGRYLSDETIKRLETSGRFNPIQLDAIKNLNALTKAGTGGSVRFFYQPASRGGISGSIRGHWREEVPYGWQISAADNIIFRTVSYDKVARNLQGLWSKQNERASSLWSSPVSLLADTKVYLENLSAGLPGDSGLSVAKRDFINLGLGIATKDRGHVNPLYDPASVARLESFITSRRIDRTNRLTRPDRDDSLPWSYEAYTRGKLNLTAGREGVSKPRFGDSDAQFTPGAGNPDTRKVAEDYARSAGLPEVPHIGYDELPEGKLRVIADHFAKEAKHDPEDPEVRKSYGALIAETKAQYAAMAAAGVRIEPWAGKGEPYKSSAGMMADVRDSKHLWFFLTDSGFGPSGEPLVHPMLEPSGVKLDGRELLNNDLFRAVHDYFGHTQQGFQFGPRGEFNAWKSHSKMFSPEAQGALAAETLAQNAWVNFGPHLRRADGSVPKRGEDGYVEPAKRMFAEQKATVIPATLRQFSAGLGFHSQLVNTLEAIPEKASREQIEAALRDGVKVRGQLVERPVKQEEMADVRDQTGQSFAEWLAANPKATRQDMLDFAQENRVQVRDRITGAGSALKLRENVDEEDQDGMRLVDVVGDNGTRFTGTREEAHRYFLEEIEMGRGGGATKYEDYTLPGGENYREAILTLPPKDRGPYTSSHFPTVPNYLAHARYNERILAPALEEELTGIAEKMRAAVGAKSVASLGSGAAEMALAKGAVTEAEARAYSQSRGWVNKLNPHGNVGRKVLFAEEIQSDLHQEGRKNGYGAGKVPDAPFKKSWPELVMKYLLRTAAEKGADKLAWTTGEQQAERYDLSKRVRAVYARKRKDGTVSVSISRRGEGGRTILADAAKIEDLPGMVGKELAEKIAAQPLRLTSAYDGLDLKMGGEGMNAFYDRIIPSIADKLGKKYGVKTETLELPGARGEEFRVEPVGGLGLFIVTDSQGRGVSQSFSDRPVAEDYAAKLSIESASGPKVHALPITDQMRKDILERGQPLYSAGRDPDSPDDEPLPGENAPTPAPRFPVTPVPRTPVDPSQDAGNPAADGFGYKTLEGERGRARAPGPQVGGVSPPEGSAESRDVPGAGADAGRGVSFRASLADAAEKHPAGAAVTVKKPEFYGNARLFISDDGKTGAAVTSDGDLTSVFRAPGADTPIDEILAKAAPHAVKLDAFASGNGYLPNLYARHGFRPVARVAFDPAIAPANWPEKLGKPDVVFMVRDPGGVTGAPEVQGNYVEVAGQVPLVSYDEALTRQELAVEAVRKAARKPGR